jgi:hypothetical protein
MDVKEIRSVALEGSAEPSKERVMELRRKGEDGQPPHAVPVHGLLARDGRVEPMERELRIEVARIDGDRMAARGEPRGDLGDVAFDPTGAGRKAGR